MRAPNLASQSVANADPNATTGVGPNATQTTVPPTGTQRYTLGDEIARGGMGIIYRATDTFLGREVAVKVLHEKYAPDSGAALRFAGEARITSQLQHPSIPPVHDLGTLADGRPFLAMKLIQGQTLEEWLNNRTDPAAERGRFVAAFEHICQALGYAHSHDVIHRDLKPANVMVGAFGEVQVMDWGLAKVLGAETAPTSPAETSNEGTRRWTQISPTPDVGSHTQAGSVLGTPAFAPPEQALGEIEKVDTRADVFGLGAILAVILTGKPPYVGETFESVRVMAARGKLDDCFARLAACGAEPELVALCKRCLAFEPADRPANAGKVAAAVAELRAAADERARRAEMERVRVEGAQATAEARAAERRKRRRLGIGATVVLAVAVVGGLTAVVAVQQRANTELAEEQAKVEARNKELADEQVKVQARFDTAVKAIETFHTGVSEDALLKNPQLKELRTKLLKQAAGFYADLEMLLGGQTDAKSRRTLAAGYCQLAELTEKIGDKTEALRVHRQALAVRRELAAARGANVETRLDVARSLLSVSALLTATGDPSGALAVLEEGRDLAERLVTDEPTDTVRTVLALSHSRQGLLLGQTSAPAKALESHGKALAIRQELADADPTVTSFQSELAWSHMNIGAIMIDTGKPAEALNAYQKALAIRQKLADANPAVTQFQNELATSHNAIGLLLSQDGKPAEALKAYDNALAIWQKLSDANPAVASYQSDLALIHYNSAVLQREIGKPGEVLKSYEKALDIETRFERSRALALLAGLGGDVKSGVTKDEAKTFADQAIAAIADAVKTGWGQPSELKEPDFDALRDRADFQKLFAEVEAKVANK